MMWVAPLETLVDYFKQTFLMSQQVNSPMFFNGVLNPEGEFGINYFYYYLLVMFNLTTPIILLGILSLAVVWRKRKEIGESSELSFSSVGVFIALLVFLVLLTFSSKKADRYVVSAFMLLDMLAGVGYWLLLSKLHAVYPKFKSWLVVGGAILVIGLQALLVFSVAPYYHSYYNPMWGSAERYSEKFQIGWGEGLDQAAHYLNIQEGVNKKTIYSWYSATLDMFYGYRSEELFIAPARLDEQFEDVLAADYAVVYISQWQRQPETKLI